MARAAEAAGVRIVGGDTKVVERGHADGMYITTTGLGRRDPRAAVRARAPRRPDPALRRDRRARHRDHARARRVRPRRRHRLRHALPVARRRRAARTPAASAHCATRPAAASPPCSTSSRAPRAWRCSCARPPCRSHPPSPAPASCSGIDPMYVANEGKFVALVAPEHADAALAALRRFDAQPPTSARSRPSRPAWCSWQTSFGGKRVMDELVGDPLPRIC